MPQFNPEFFATQLFWLVIIFGALYLLLSKFALPRLGTVLETRERRIEGDLQQARVLQKRAEEVRENLVELQADMRQRVKSIIDDMKTDIASIVAEKQKTLNAQIMQETQAAEKRIASVREEAFASIRETVGAVTLGVVEKLQGDAPSSVLLEKVVADVTVAYQRKVG